MKLYLDDLRQPPEGYVLARSSDEAIALVRELGWPQFMSLDHDLGGDDTTMRFLRMLVNEWDGVSSPPDYQVHSANPVGRENIISFLESWKRSCLL